MKVSRFQHSPPQSDPGIATTKPEPQHLPKNTTCKPCTLLSALTAASRHELSVLVPVCRLGKRVRSRPRRKLTISLVLNISMLQPQARTRPSTCKRRSTEVWHTVLAEIRIAHTSRGAHGHTCLNCLRLSTTTEDKAHVLQPLKR